jgi:hypothetical protein
LRDRGWRGEYSQTEHDENYSDRHLERQGG